jgi:ABC-2 type transport system ATP-binding protein
VKLATALVHDPELLFLDEPTNGLDPRSRDEMLALIAELPERRGCSIVLSTHLLPDVERVCDHAVIMHRGRVRFVGTIDELRGVREGSGLLNVEVKADAAKLAGVLTAVGATCEVMSPVSVVIELPPQTSTQIVFEHARAAGLQIRQLRAMQESVEAAFLRVIGTDETGDDDEART